jgi:hypothetical protein
VKIRHVFCAVAALAGLASAAAAETETRYLAAFIDGKKIGHAAMTRTATEKEVTHKLDSVLEIRRVGTLMKIRQSETTVETPEGKPLRFASTQDIGVMAMKVRGTVADGKMTVEITSAGETQTRASDWPKGALLNEGLALLSRKMGLKEGTAYTARMFEPSMLQVLDATIRVGPKKMADLLGRVVELIEIKTTVATPLGKMMLISYVDDELTALKTVAPVAGMKVEMIACSRAFALSKNDPADFLDKMCVESPGPLEGLPKARSVTYHLSPKGKAKLEIPALDGQTVQPGERDTVVVTVSPVQAPSGVVLTNNGADKAARGAV